LRPGSKPKRARPSEDRRRVILPDGRLDIDVELDLVAIRILDIQTVGDGVMPTRRPLGIGVASSPTSIRSNS